MKREEGWIESADGNRLFWRRHTPEEDPRAILLMVHGLAEHSGRYLHVLDHFANVGFDCWAHDYRGHGQSPGLRVHVREFDEFLTTKPATQDELVDLAVLVFPGTDPAIIAADVSAILRDFLSERLIVSA